MRNIQRVYIYVMAYASLVGVLAGLINSAQILLYYAFGLGFEVEDFALWAGVLVVTVPLHLGHAWWMARLAREEEERAASLRKLYMYAILLLGTFLVFSAAYQLLKGLLAAALGQPIADFVVWWVKRLEAFISLLGGLLLIWYGVVLIRGDGDFERERGWAALWRRLYVFLVGIVGLGLLVRGAVGVLQMVWYALLPPVPAVHSTLVVGSWWAVPLAHRLAILLIGLLVWRVGWFWERRWTLPSAPDAERESLLRQAYYYVGVALGLAVFLVALAYLLRQGLLWLFGTSWGAREEWWPSLSLALSALPVGLVVWLEYRRQILPVHRVAPGTYPTIVERLYTYLASAIGLGVAWWGVVDLVRVLTHTLLWGSSSIPVLSAWWPKPLATGIALSVVGFPTWLWHWHRVQDLARRPDEVGQKERASLLRRVYLYGFALVAGLIVLVDLSRVAQQVWLWILGVESQRLLSEVVNASGPALTAFLVWVYHMKVIVTDTRGQKPPAPEVDIEQLQAERERLLQRLKEIEDKLSAMQE